MNSNQPIVIIGAGLGGLAAACTLSARGHRVIVLETNEWTGGKAAVLEKGGYRFDMGPTILTLPSVLEKIFSEAKVPLASALDLIRLDPQWRSFFVDGTTLDLVTDQQKMMANIEALAPASGSADGYQRFLRLSREQDDLSRRWFFWRSVESMSDMFSPLDLVRISTLRDLVTTRMGYTVSGLLRSYVHDERVAQMLDHFTQYVGSAPDASPAVLCSIAHMQVGEGVWYPKGGIGAVPKALRALAETLGVQFRNGASAKQIIVNKGRAEAVLLADGERLQCAAVVSNRDSVRTHRELLNGAGKAFEKRRSYEPACSGVVLYLGLKKRYDHLLHHNFVFSTDPHEEFEAIYRRGEPAPDPTCYVCAPAVSDPTVAPEGGEALYVLVHTPYLRPGHDWSKMLPEYRKVILRKLAETGGMTDLEERIEVEHVLTPQDIHERYQVLNGAIYGLASHGRVNGAFKPGNRSRDVEGLYLAGGSAHPGPGMPMALMSGWIAADTLDHDARGEMETAAVS